MNNQPPDSPPESRPPESPESPESNQGKRQGAGGGPGGPAGSPGWNPPPPPPPPGGYPAAYAAPAPPPAPRGGGGIITRIVTGLVASLLLISIILNFYLGLYFVSSISGPQETVYQKGDVENRIVVIPVTGMINQETSVNVRQALTALRDNPPKAVILRVDSGGGGVSPSDRIWHQIKQFKQELDIPIVASFGSVAASGGYYISAGTDYIFVEPTTLTGSIGVIAQAFTVQELMEKIGVTPEIIAATQANKKDTLSPFRAWDEDDRNELRVILDQAHVRFIDIVAEGRKQVLTRQQVQVLATGEPFTAQQALDNKLVDEQGYLEQAIAKAGELAGLSADARPAVMVISPRKGFSLLGLLGMSQSVPSMKLPDGDHLRETMIDLSTPRVEYRAKFR